jgi:FKBP-type peptidyl-prolyl cis-trans isomerase
MEEEKKSGSNQTTQVAVVVIILVLVVAVGYFLKMKTNNDNIASTSVGTQVNPPSATAVPTTVLEQADVLKSEDLKVGTGSAVKKDDKILVNYLGTLTDGTKFDSSYDRNVTFEFTVGAGEVIDGWERGVIGMKVGGKRRLTIPSSLGYGAQAVGTIPANSTLIFEIELVKIE